MSITFDFATIDYPSAAVTAPAAINDFGEVVGVYTSPDINKAPQGFVLSDGRFVTFKPGGATVAPTGVNNRGDIVGATVLDGQPREFLYTSGKFELLPAPATGQIIIGSINDLRQITLTNLGPVSETSYVYQDGHYSVFSIPDALFTEVVPLCGTVWRLR